MMRLGGKMFRDVSTPDKWIQELKRFGYRTSICPVDSAASDFEIVTFRQAAKTNDIVISEVGAWSNPISSDDRIQRAAISHCKGQLELAEKMGAVCCVNIAGSLSEEWNGPHPDHYHPDTFALVVDTIREIIDDVKPVRAKYALEMLPWMIPDGTDSYEQLIKAIDREAFAVHFDPVNMLTSPRAFYHNADLIRDFIKRLGHLICNVHVKDIALANELTVHLSEVEPGKGGLNYPVLLKELQKLGNDDLPLMLEHYEQESSYVNGADYIRKKATERGIEIK